MWAAVEQEASWVFPCRARDLPYWVDAELWRVELEGPAPEARSQISAPRARLAERTDDDVLIARRLVSHLHRHPVTRDRCLYPFALKSGRRGVMFPRLYRNLGTPGVFRS